jgi:hypothetical protein
MKKKWLIGGVITILSILIGILVTSLSCDNYIDDDDDDDYDDDEDIYNGRWL